MTQSAGVFKLARQRVLLGMVLLSIAGCGGTEYSLAPVSGTVTLGGKPLADAQVTFSPAAGQLGPSSLGTTDAEGHFQLMTLDHDLTGAVPGQHRVSVVTSKVDTEADERTKIVFKEVVPRKYRDGSLRIEVPEAGTEEADIEIIGK